jgi:hypothetical protein
MSLIKDIERYRKAAMLHKAGHDVLANLFLRAAYGVK